MPASSNQSNNLPTVATAIFLGFLCVASTSDAFVRPNRPSPLRTCVISSQELRENASCTTTSGNVVVPIERQSKPTPIALKSTQTASLDEEVDAEEEKRATITISARPPVYRTVLPPFVTLARRDPETGQWFSLEDNSVLDGPPANYWRQSIDERLYERCTSVLFAALNLYDTADTSGRGDDIDGGAVAVFEEEWKKLKRAGGSPRSPLTSRKLLGTWAPILHAGKRVVAFDPAEETLEVSLMVNFMRKDGPRYEKHRYGNFHAGVEEGELIRIVSSDFSVDETIVASKDATASIGEGVESFGNTPLVLDNILHLSEYLLVQERPGKEREIDLWMRVDPVRQEIPAQPVPLL